MCNILIDRVVKGKPTIKTIEAEVNHNPGQPHAVLTVTDERKKTERYRLLEFPCDFDGRAFRLEKITGEVYHVCVSASVEECQCSCIGFGHTGWCKHVAGIRGLIAVGELPHPCDREANLALGEADVQSDAVKCQECGAPCDPFDTCCETCRIWLRDNMNADVRSYHPVLNPTRLAEVMR